MKKLLSIAAILLLAASPLAFAHDSTTGSTDVGPNTGCWPTQDPHDYGAPGTAVSGTSSTGTGRTGITTVGDHNLEDCDGDGAPDDFDGDRELGVGGGFFPAGVYAADPTCDYGFTAHHGPNFHAHAEVPDESAGVYVRFDVGSDPTPPTLVPSVDPEDDDGFECVGDGSITPDVDTDDCLESFVHAGTTTCLPGGDGGWWVWVGCHAGTTQDDVSPGLRDADGDGIPDGADPRVTPPDSLDAACSAAGHIYSDGGSGTDPTPLPLPELPARAVPPLLAALPGAAGTVVLSWTAPVGGEPPTSYNVYRGECPACIGSIASVPALPGVPGVFVDSGVVDGRSYFYNVAPVTADGEGDLSNQAFTTVRAPPDMTAPILHVVGGDQSADLQWTFWSLGAFPTGFNVYRGTCSGCATGTPIATVPPAGAVGTFKDTGLSNDVRYFYQVEALFGPGNPPSLRSNEASAEARAHAETAIVSWNAWVGALALASPGLSCDPVGEATSTGAVDVKVVYVECEVTTLVSNSACFWPYFGAGVASMTTGDKVRATIECGTLWDECDVEVGGAGTCPKSVGGSSTALDFYCEAFGEFADLEAVSHFYAHCSNDP